MGHIEDLKNFLRAALLFITRRPMQKVAGPDWWDRIAMKPVKFYRGHDGIVYQAHNQWGWFRVPSVHQELYRETTD